MLRISSFQIKNPIAFTPLFAFFQNFNALLALENIPFAPKEEALFKLLCNDISKSK
jgi:hypothetical protein